MKKLCTQQFNNLELICIIPVHFFSCAAGCADCPGQRLPRLTLTRLFSNPSEALLDSFLAIETATDVCSVAVLRDDQVVIEISRRKPRTHSENLVPMIREALAYAGLSPDTLSGIAVSKGPGSYTGLRIGVSAAKGLAFSHQLDLVGIPSLTGLAHVAAPFAPVGATLAMAFNSRRNEVYLGLFTLAATGAVQAHTPIASMPLDEISPFIEKSHTFDSIPHKLVVAGEGGPHVAACMASDDRFEVELLPQTRVTPSAAAIATLGAARHKSGELDNLETFEPFYLNEFIPKSRKKSIFDRLPF